VSKNGLSALMRFIPLEAKIGGQLPPVFGSSTKRVGGLIIRSGRKPA